LKKIVRFMVTNYKFTCFIIPFAFFALFSGAWYHGDDFTSMPTLGNDWLIVIKRIISAHTFQVGQDPHYRPLANLFSAIAIKTSPFVGHLLSAIIHAMCSLMVFLLVKQITNSTKSAWISWLFYITYPPLSAAIFWISAVGDLLTSLFALLTALMFTKQQKSRKNLVVMLLFFCCSVLSKEMSFTLPVILLIYSIFNSRFKEDKTKLLLLFTAASALFMLRFIILSHLLMGSYNTSYFASLSKPLVSLAKYFYSMLIYIPLSLTVKEPLYFLAAIPFLVFLIMLFLSLSVKTRWKSLLVFAVLFIAVYAPVSGTFSTWRMYYPGTLLAIGIGIAMKFSLNELWLKSFLISIFISFTTCGFIGLKNIEAGKFNRNLTVAVHHLQDKEITIAAVPVGFGSYSSLLSSYEYLEYALFYLYGDNKKISYAVPQTADSLPARIVLAKIIDKKMVFYTDMNKYSYFVPDTGLMGKRSFTFKTGRLNRFGKPTSAEIIFTNTQSVYFLK